MVKIIVWGGGHGRQDDGRNGKKILVYGMKTKTGTP